MPLAQRARACGVLQDGKNFRIRRVDIATGATTTFAGSGSIGSVDGDSTTAQFNYPSGVAIAPSGAFALVAVRAWPRNGPASRLAPALGTQHRALC